MDKRARMIRLTLTSILLALLAGCQQNSMNDLERFVATAHKGKKPEVEPLPTIKPIEGYAYSAAGYPDPFSSQNLKPRRVAASATGTGPDKNRRREPLENFPLDSLTMVGTLFRENENRVIIKTPRGAVQTAKVGNYVGQNYGKIVGITEKEVSVKEQVLNSSGIWIERDATLTLKR
jgi:type IV pilus assembly protein PilP